MKKYMVMLLSNNEVVGQMFVEDKDEAFSMVRQFAGKHQIEIYERDDSPRGGYMPIWSVLDSTTYNARMNYLQTELPRRAIHRKNHDAAVKLNGPNVGTEYTHLKATIKRCKRYRQYT